MTGPVLPPSAARPAALGPDRVDPSARAAAASSRRRRADRVLAAVVAALLVLAAVSGSVIGAWAGAHRVRGVETYVARQIAARTGTTITVTCPFPFVRGWHQTQLCRVEDADSGDTYVVSIELHADGSIDFRTTVDGNGNDAGSGDPAA